MTDKKLDAEIFIARKLRFKGRLPMACICVSFLVMILAVSVSSGFRSEIRKGVSSVAGDVRILSQVSHMGADPDPMEKNPSYLEALESVRGIESIEPVVSRAGIIKSGDTIHGVLFKGSESFEGTDSLLLASIPSRLASLLGLKEGDAMVTYFVGEETRVRKFVVKDIYRSVLDDEDKLVVHTSLKDMQRLNGWDENMISSMEIRLDRHFTSVEAIDAKASEIGSVIRLFGDDEETPVYVSSTPDSYPQLFDWLALIDSNVLFILILMTLVAGFNMISGLLIMLFENISTIGVLKSMGMRDRNIAKVFLSCSSELVLKGMALGNAIALAFCLIQGLTHLIPLNPRNYFISFVPIRVNLPLILAADLVSYVLIMILLLIPCRFVSKVDPAQTVRVD